MEIFDFSDNIEGTKGMMLTVTKKEALRIINSLSSQMINDSPNTGRVENYATLHKGDVREEIYFSIAVNDNAK